MAIITIEIPDEQVERAVAAFGSADIKDALIMAYKQRIAQHEADQAVLTEIDVRQTTYQTALDELIAE